MPILLSLVYHLQKNMIISPIELCNPSVADAEGAALFIQYPAKKKIGLYMLQEAPFQALDFDIFLEEHDPGPLYSTQEDDCVSAVVCIRNYSKQIGFNCWMHHCPPHKMSANAYFMPIARSICMCLASKCINSRCSWARRQMGCS